MTCCGRGSSTLSGSECCLLLTGVLVVPCVARNGVVKYESVMGLRKKLEQLGKMEGVSTAEKGLS